MVCAVCLNKYIDMNTKHIIRKGSSDKKIKQFEDNWKYHWALIKLYTYSTSVKYLNKIKLIMEIRQKKTTFPD